jgi:predicted nucleic acid-binding protein
VIVVDSSALLDLLLALDPNARWVSERVEDAGWDLHAPHLVDVEAVGALRRLSAAGAVDAGRARRALDELQGFRLRRYPHTHLLDRVWELREHVNAADATYVALAEALAAPLVTTDRRLARAHGAHVPVLAP